MKLTQKAYRQWLSHLKADIRQAQVRNAVQVNTSLLFLYWYIGRQIVEKIEREAWGTKIIDRLAEDLRLEFGDNTGFSVRNLKYMRKFAELHPDFAIVQPPVAQLQKSSKPLPAKGFKSNLIVQPVVAQLDFLDKNQLAQQLVAQISWSHHLVLMDKVDDSEERLWYTQKTIENGWSKTILIHQIESGLYERQAKAKKITNFNQTLPPLQSALANEMLKDPYKFALQGLTETATERDLENLLVHHITSFLLELGAGFAFVGKQVHVKVGKKDHYLDLLFYHLHLHCYVVIELKMQEFEPGHASQLNLYLNLVDDFIRKKGDNNTIGILLCKEKDSFEVEYTLRGLNKPIGVSKYQLSKFLTEDLRKSVVDKWQVDIPANVSAVNRLLGKTKAGKPKKSVAKKTSSTKAKIISKKRKK
jgi:predicted nuclease of restriction endonuclease-like (RecB) superfamily